MLNKLIDINDIEKKFEKLKNLIIVQCHGVFDILHYGHINYLIFSKKKGDILIVTITSDKFVNKGYKRPYFNQLVRAKSLAALECVDYVCINNSPTSEDIIKQIKPNFYVKGSDYKSLLSTDKNLQLEKKSVEAVGGKLIFSVGKIFSSSSIINSNFNIFNQKQKEFINKIKKKYSYSYISNQIDKFSSLKVLLIGEAIIDQYIFCNPVGKSGKEPILINKKIKSEKYAGGILAVANHLSSFCKEVRVLSYLGDRQNYYEFIKKSLKKNIKFEYINKNNSPTILKSRYIDNYTKNKIIGLYDLNDENFDDKDEKLFLKKLEKNISNFDLTLVVDYGHGLITPKISKFIQKKSKFLSVNAQLNSLNSSYHSICKYSKADYICVHEGELQHEFRSKYEKIESLILKLQKKMKTANIVITQGSKGSISLNKKKFTTCPAFAEKVVDRTGAGDTIIAVSTLCFKQKIPDDITLLVGNVSAASTVLHLGTGNSIEKNEILKKIRYIFK